MGGTGRTSHAFARELAEAIDRRGVSLAWLSRRLGASGNAVSVATLSYWRSGSRRPERHTSLAAVEELEVLLRLEPGHLMSRIGPTRRLGPPSAEREILDLMPARGSLGRGMAALDFDDLTDPHEVVSHVTMDFDETGALHRYTLRSLMRARSDGVERVCQVFTLDAPASEQPELVEHHGFTPGRTWFDPDAGVWMLERLLPTPLELGEQVLMESAVTVPRDPEAECVYAHHLSRRMASLLVWLRFHPDRVPRAAEKFWRVDDAEVVHHLGMSSSASVYGSFSQAGPGVVGLRWTW